MSILTSILGLPLVAAAVLALVPRNYRVIMRAVAVVATLLSALLASKMFVQFNGAAPGPSGYRFEQQIPWVQALGISYHVGVDGINVGLLLMGAIVAFAAACVSWEIKEREKEFYILLLVMTGGILGAFASLDLFLFYFFHELALVPTFIMIGVWGRGEQKNYATFQITLYLSLGALVVLAGLIALYVQSGADTFDIPQLTEYLHAHPLSVGAQNFIFPLLLFGFGILVSLWPFHTWAPLGYGSAPSATAMLHAGVLKKFGLYGLIRIALPLLPGAAQSWMQLVAWLCLGNLVYCGWVAMRQKDLNWLVGYSSVAHMGFAFLGIATLNLIGVTGAVLVMIAHGFLAALTFGLSGYIYNQTGTLEIRQLGGLLRRLPFIGSLLLMAAFAGCGLPGFANFAGEVTVFFGAWGVHRLVTVLACWGALVIGAIYLLRAVGAMLHGPALEKWSAVVDATHTWRRTPFVLLLFGLLLFGFWPRLLVDKIQISVGPIVAELGARAMVGANSGLPLAFMESLVSPLRMKWNHEPCKAPLTPTLSRRERGSVPQSSCARAFMESLLDNEIAHWDLEPKLVQLRNFADRLPSILPLPPGEGRGEGASFSRFMGRENQARFSDVSSIFRGAARRPGLLPPGETGGGFGSITRTTTFTANRCLAKSTRAAVSTTETSVWIP